MPTSRPISPNSSTLITQAASDSGSPGGRFSHAQLAKLSSVNNLVGDITHGIATSIGRAWGHGEGSILKRIAPGVFSTRETSDWNNCQGRYAALLKAKNREGVCDSDSMECLLLTDRSI